MFKPKFLLVILLAAILTACPTPTPPPPTPLGLTATTTSSAGIQLSWVASLDANSYTLERRTDASAFVNVATGIRTTTYADDGLQGSTKYTYRVRAVGAGGTSDPSTEAFATTQVDLVNLQATVTSSVAANLSWSSVPGATGYTVERKLGMGSYSTLSSPPGTSYADSGLTPNTQYTYRVTALQPASSVADEASITTLPSNPTNVNASFPGTGVTLTWTAPTEPGTYTYTLERKQGAGAYSSLGTVGATSYTDSGATGGATYTYRIKAVSNGVSSSGAEKTVSVALATPTGFVTSNLTTKKVTLTWNAVPGATSYILLRKANAGTFDPLTTLSGTTYTDSSLAPTNKYTYRLQATNGSATSATVDSSVVDTTPQAPIKVLFIGNSLTFVNSVPLMIQTLASDAGEFRAFQFEMVVQSGASLSYHWTNTTAPSPGARASIQSGPASGGDWDYVVLQELSINPVCDQNSFNTNGTMFATEVKTYNPNAKVILHQNWVITDTATYQSCGAYFSSPLPKLVANTNALADSLNPVAKVVPVGQAWGNTSGIILQQLDGIHATPEGSYLAASTYYAFFYGKSPVGLTNVVQRTPNCTSGSCNMSPLTPYTINSSTAATLQTTAWNTVQSDNHYHLP